MASATVPSPSPQENVAWERQQAPRAGLAAIASGLLGVIALVISSVTYRHAPHAYLTDGLRDAAGQSVPDGGLRTRFVLFLDGHEGGLIATAITLAVASVLLAPVLGYLFRAVSGRRPQTPRVALYAGLIGPVLVGVGQIVLQIALVSSVSDFASSKDHSTKAAHDVFGGGVLAAAQIIVILGTFALALALVIIALNAMRAGLLTRFMGVLGIVVGVLIIFSSGSGVGAAGIGQGSQIVQTFWLVAIGWLIIGRWPSGVPQAWADGEAHPWPSQQQMREQRERAAREQEPEPEPADEPHPSSRKRKRKRRV